MTQLPLLQIENIKKRKIHVIDVFSNKAIIPIVDQTKSYALELFGLLDFLLVPIVQITKFHNDFATFFNDCH